MSLLKLPFATVHVNPVFAQVKTIIELHQSARFTLTTRFMYVWNGYYATHAQVRPYLAEEIIATGEIVETETDDEPSLKSYFIKYNGPGAYKDLIKALDRCLRDQLITFDSVFHQKIVNGIHEASLSAPVVEAIYHAQ